jgi:hypothetical protein
MASRSQKMLKAVLAAHLREPHVKGSSMRTEQVTNDIEELLELRYEELERIHERLHDEDVDDSQP